MTSRLNQNEQTTVWDTNKPRYSCYSVPRLWKKNLFYIYDQVVYIGMGMVNIVYGQVVYKGSEGVKIRSDS